MPRVLTPEHKRAMQEGRKRAKDGKQKEVKHKEKKKRVLSAESKANIKRALANARAERKANGTPIQRKKRENKSQEKPIIWLTGKEKIANDYFPAIRTAFRSIGNYIISPKIIHEIIKKDTWTDTKKIHLILEKYAVLKVIKNHISKK